MDQETIAVYDAKADEYRSCFAKSAPGADLRRFMAALPPGARVLDLGAGPGAAASAMTEAGHAVDAWDASPAMVALAKEAGLNAALRRFDELTAEAAYDGIWANFSLLHAPRAALGTHLAAIAKALKPGGVFHIGMKTGTGEARDALGRKYTFVTKPELAALLTAAGFAIRETREGRDKGLAGTIDPWVTHLAEKADA